MLDRLRVPVLQMPAHWSRATADKRTAHAEVVRHVCCTARAVVYLVGVAAKRGGGGRAFPPRRQVSGENNARSGTSGCWLRVCILAS